MEQKETTTQHKEDISTDNKQQDTSNADDGSATTPSSSSNWWGGWISQAKERSASVLEAVKNDLNEITSAVAETFNTSSIEEEDLEYEKVPTTNQEADKPESSTVSFMKQSLSTFFVSVTDALIPQLDDEDTSEAVMITTDDTIVLTGFAKHLADMQNNDETYLEEPSKTTELAEKYKMWLEIVEQDQFTQQRVDKMLESSEILNEKYNKFVPDTVSHMNFFKRYLFKKALLEDELANEERRRKEVVIEKQPEPVAVVEPQVDVVGPTPALKSDMVGDMEIANFELSEEEQARLLDDYEQEIKEREKTKTDSTELASEPKSAMKISKNPSKSNSNVQSKGKNNKNVKFQQQQQKSTQQQTKGEKGKKADAQLKMEKDHFKKESDEKSSASDESWEKEFDL